jgi:hypothetical protein
MNNLSVTVWINREDTRQSWSVKAENFDGYEVGSVQIRRLTENKAIGFIFGFENDSANEPEDSKATLSALVGKIVENAPKHNFGILQATAIAGSANAEVLESLGFEPYARFVNPNTGNTLRLYGKTL